MGAAATNGCVRVGAQRREKGRTLAWALAAARHARTALARSIIVLEVLLSVVVGSLSGAAQRRRFWCLAGALRTCLMERMDA